MNIINLMLMAIFDKVILILLNHRFVMLLTIFNITKMVDKKIFYKMLRFNIFDKKKFFMTIITSSFINLF